MYSARGDVRKGKKEKRREGTSPVERRGGGDPLTGWTPLQPVRESQAVFGSERTVPKGLKEGGGGGCDCAAVAPPPPRSPDLHVV